MQAEICSKLSAVVGWRGRVLLVRLNTAAAGPAGGDGRSHTQQQKAQERDGSAGVEQRDGQLAGTESVCQFGKAQDHSQACVQGEEIVSACTEAKEESR